MKKYFIFLILGLLVFQSLYAQTVGVFDRMDRFSGLRFGVGSEARMFQYFFDTRIGAQETYDNLFKHRSSIMQLEDFDIEDQIWGWFLSDMEEAEIYFLGQETENSMIIVYFKYWVLINVYYDSEVKDSAVFRR